MVRICVVGIAVVDLVFRVEAMPRAAEKYRASDAVVITGGCAANAAAAIARLGAQAMLATRIGDDVIGNIIQDELTRKGVDLSMTKKVQGAKSSFSSVLVDSQAQRQIVNFRGNCLTESPQWSLPEVDAVLVDNRWPQAAERALRLAREQGIPGIVDCENDCQLALLELASHAAFSRQGLTDLTGESDLPVALQQISASLPDCWVCVTDGTAGVYRAEGRRIVHHPAFSVDAVDTLGAGDVWHGAFALSLARGDSEADAVTFASAAAALRCTTFGGSGPTLPKTQQFLKENKL